MANLSLQKRQRILEFLQTIREEHKNDDDVLASLCEIESALNAKKYGLVKDLLLTKKFVFNQVHQRVPKNTHFTTFFGTFPV